MENMSTTLSPQPERLPERGPSRSRRTWKLALTCAVSLLLIGAWLLQTGWVSVWLLHRALPRNRDRLVFHKDYEGLLNACREVISHRQSYSQAVPRDTGTGGDLLPTGVCSPAVGDVGLPEMLRALRVTYYVVSEDRLRAELYGCGDACAHFGLVAFAPGMAPRAPKDLIDSSRWSFPPERELEDMAVELTPGLWYYDTRLDGPRWVRHAVQRHSEAQRSN